MPGAICQLSHFWQVASDAACGGKISRPGPPSTYSSYVPRPMHVYRGTRHARARSKRQSPLSILVAVSVAWLLLPLEANLWRLLGLRMEKGCFGCAVRPGSPSTVYFQTRRYWHAAAFGADRGGAFSGVIFRSGQTMETRAEECNGVRVHEVPRQQSQNSTWGKKRSR